MKKKSALHRQEQRMAWLLITPATLVFLVILAYPIFENIRSSLFDLNLMTGSSKFIGIENFKQILTDAGLRASLRNTVIWTVGSLVGQIGLGLFAALMIDQPWRGMRFIRQILLIPYVVPVIATALLWRWLLDGRSGIVSHQLQEFGLINVGMSPLGMESTSLLTVIIINIWRGFPFAMLVFWASLQSIDQSQYEAAKVDGAGPIREFVSITLPNLMGAIWTLVALRGVWTLMHFELVWLTTRGGPTGSSETLATYLYKIIMGEFKLGYGAAVSTSVGLILVSIVLVVLFVRRKVAKGDN